MQELKTATNHDMKSEIQRRLGETEDLIRWWKELVSEYERQISKRVESLSQLSQGEFAVFCPLCTCILLLITCSQSHRLP